MNGPALAEQLRYVAKYLTDLAKDLETPIPETAPPACRNGEHMEAAELPGRCVICGTELPSGGNSPEPGGAGSVPG